jgi:hypothetical protein
MKDGIDMLAASELENFYFLSGMHIPKLCNILGRTLWAIKGGGGNVF